MITTAHLCLRYWLVALATVATLASGESTPATSVEEHDDLLGAKDEEIAVSVDIKNEFSIFNYEYFDIPYQQGESVLGDVLEARLGLHPSTDLALYIGVVARKPYDGHGLDKTYPLLTMAWKACDDNTLLLGSLPRRHDFTPQVYHPLLEFRRIHRDGFEYSSQYSTLFLAWEQFETIDHSERFSGNWIWRRPLRFFTLLSEARWTHSGGQLFDHPETGVIQDRVGSIGLEAQIFSLDAVAVRFEPRIFGNLYSVNAQPEKNKKGGAGSLRFHVETPGPDIAYELWASRHFYTEDGDPLYQTKKMHTLSFAKKLVVAQGRLQMWLEAKGHWLEGKFAHQQAIRIDFELDRKWARK